MQEYVRHKQSWKYNYESVYFLENKIDKFVWNLTCVVLLHETTNQAFIYIMKFQYYHLII